MCKLQIFNEFNARKPDEFNIFKGITKNYLFMGIIAVTLVLQVRHISSCFCYGTIMVQAVVYNFLAFFFFI